MSTFTIKTLTPRNNTVEVDSVNTSPSYSFNGSGGTYSSIDTNINIDTITKGNKQGNPADPTTGTTSTLEWVGTGIFDAFIRALGKNIEMQHDEGRISGEEYANAYVQVLQICLQQSLELVKVQKDVAIKDAMNKSQVSLENAKIAMQNALNAAQIEVAGIESEIKYALGKAQVEIQDAQEKAQEHKIAAEVEIHKRQLIGFADQLQLKMFEAQANAFSMIYSSGMLDGDIAGVFSNNALSDEYRGLAKLRDAHIYGF